MESESPQGLSLYPAQAEGVRRFMASPISRLLLAYGTGCGKTPTTIKAIEAHFAREMRKKAVPRESPRVLVICPALVRRHWCREFQRWISWEAWPVEMGRQRKSGTKAAKELRDRAYAARIQVVSYDLLGQVDAEGWNYLVFDEIHHLRSPLSKQSRTCLGALLANPRVPVLGLSATLIPTVVKQIWNPLRLLFGHAEWHGPSRTGDVSWRFAERYCGIESNDYGCWIGDGIPERLPELRERVSQVSHQLSRSDIASDLPPLNVRLLDQPGYELGRALRAKEREEDHPLVKAAVDWQADLGEDVKKVVILTYHRSLAQAIHKGLCAADLAFPTHYLDGTKSTAERSEKLLELDAATGCILVATSESLREGVRLMWAEHVLLAEWRQAPSQVLQIMGRFQSVGDSRKPFIDVLYDESMASQAATLISRINKITEVLQSGEAEATVTEKFQPKALDDKALARLTLDLFGDVDAGERRSAFTENEDETDD